MKEPVRPAARFAAIVLAAFAVAACGGSARLPIEAGIGPHPTLPPPETSLIPTVKVAEARGWRAGEKPTPGAGLAVNAFATGLDHPRFVYVLPNGDVLVAETNAPPRPEDSKGIRGWFFRRFQKKAGGAVPSANRITLLRDADGDGSAELRTVLLDSLMSPFGIALVGDDLYVANSDALVRAPYRRGDTRIASRPVKVIDLPAGPINHHWTKNVVANPGGSLLYVAVGSNSNAGENGIDKEEGRGAVWEVNPVSGAHRVFASGMRNPVGMSWEPQRGALWVSVNERDELGSDLVPDYMTAIRDGAFYGFPYFYYGDHADTRFTGTAPSILPRVSVPDYALGSHTASLGLAFARGSSLPAPFSNGAFVGQHGSWNRKPQSGYKVVFVPFADGQPAGAPIDVLTGFLDGDGHARGRPVSVAIDGRGALLVADDVGNTIWRVTRAPTP